MVRTYYREGPENEKHVSSSSTLSPVFCGPGNAAMKLTAYQIKNQLRQGFANNPGNAV
jgi:hypothetical protein